MQSVRITHFEIRCSERPASIMPCDYASEKQFWSVMSSENSQTKFQCNESLVSELQLVRGRNLGDTCAYGFNRGWKCVYYRIL
jgi:hypothetical protein